MSTALTIAQRMSNLQSHLDLLGALLAKDLKVRYKGTVLGYLWSIANPLALTLVFSFVFRHVFRVEIEDFHLFLLAALLPWNWLSAGVSGATTAFLDNAHLIKKVRFPRLLIPLATVLNKMVHFILSLPVFLAFLLAAGERPSWHWLFGIPLLLAMQLAFVFGIGIAVASVNVYFRDVAHLVGVLLGLWFYATPVMYSLDMLPARVQAVLRLNPATHLIEGWRQLLLRGQLDAAALAPAALVAMGALVTGLLVYRWLEGGFADVL